MTHGISQHDDDLKNGNLDANILRLLRQGKPIPPGEYMVGIPIYVQLSGQFKKFIHQLGSPIKYPCHAHYWKKKLVLSSNKMPRYDGEIGNRSASVKCDEKYKLLIMHFVNTFNAAADGKFGKCKMSIKEEKTVNICSFRYFLLVNIEILPTD